ncbi:MAG: universal stress protein [Salinigranum sp.]
MYESILVPTDGSEGVEQALEHALDLADRHDATVHSLYVVDRRLYFAADDGDQESVRERLEARGERAVEAVRERAEAAGLNVQTAIREGYPDRDIVEYAEEHDVDVVVMGSHGRTGRDRLTHLGSVTERVVENAPCPVFVIPIE